MTMGDELAYIAAKNKYLPMVEAFWKLAIKQGISIRETKTWRYKNENRGTSTKY
mgnify:FL=1